MVRQVQLWQRITGDYFTKAHKLFFQQMLHSLGGATTHAATNFILQVSSIPPGSLHIPVTPMKPLRK